MKIYHYHEHTYIAPQIERRLRRFGYKLDLIKRNQEILMATKEEVAADLAEIKTEVAETRGAANSALVLLKETLDRVGQAAASAADLDAFRADLALIKSEVQATEADLKSAVSTNPPA